jgi:hypothetical protein
VYTDIVKRVDDFTYLNETTANILLWKQPTECNCTLLHVAARINNVAFTNYVLGDSKEKVT